MLPSKKLKSRFKEGYHICVGLDSDISKIPSFLRNKKDTILEFNKAIISETYDIAAAFKINLAFYEKDGERGLEALSKTLELIPDDVFVIGDAKRGDIGNTSMMYAESLFEHFKFDSTTLSPYMGYDSLKPFIDFKNSISFILALTSNPGSHDIEKLELVSGRKVYQEVIGKVREWNSYNNLGIVFGATNLEELKTNIQSFGDLFVLLPGVGAQGGDLEGIVKTFKDFNNQNYLINVSRDLIYADETENFAKISRQVLQNYNHTIRSVQ